MLRLGVRSPSAPFNQGFREIGSLSILITCELQARHADDPGGRLQDNGATTEAVLAIIRFRAFAEHRPGLLDRREAGIAGVALYDGNAAQLEDRFGVLRDVLSQ